MVKNNRSVESRCHKMEYFLMEFGWSEEQEQLRARMSAFLAAHLPQDWEQVASLSPGSQAVTDFSKQFCPQLAEAGLLVSHWPKEHGGAGASAWDHFLLGELLWEAGEPRGPQYYNVNWIGPTIMRYGSAAQQDYHLARMRAGDVIWCQGFSEPGAGSDLASLKTKAEWDGQEYKVTGSKIWTSYARMAEFCFLLARTGPTKRDISVFILPMDRLGIEVRPISSVVGDGDLHEVFFDGVPVQADERLGPEGLGWDVVRYALNYERVGIPRYALARRTLHRAVAVLQRDGGFDAVAKQAAAGALVACEAAQMLAYQVVDQRMKSSPAAGTTSMARLATVRAENSVADFVLDFTPHLFAGASEPMIATHHKRAIAAGIASGAAEVQRNLVARDTLGLGR